MSRFSTSIFVIDASAFVFRAYYALAPLSSKGRPSHAVAGFASMLLKLLNESKPKHCVVVFDSKKPTFRKDIYPEYKANREVAPPDLSEQIVAVMEMCRAAQFPILQDEGFEADDWIASFVKQYKTKSDIIIVSSDKDLAQLVNGRVKLWDSFRDRLMGEKEVKEKWGVEPKQMRDFQALVGDSSDNIPGLPGVGPKTAAKLLEEFSSLEALLQGQDKLKPKLQEKLVQNAELLDLSYQLVGLKEDLTLPFEELPVLPARLPSEFKRFLEEWDLKRIVSQFSEDMSAESFVEKDQSFESKLVRTKKEFKNLQEILLSADAFVFDVETSSFDKNQAKLVGIAFCCDDKESFYLPYRHGPTEFTIKEVNTFLQKLFATKVKVIAHHGKYDWQMLTREGIDVATIHEDTMIIAHLLFADRRSFSLDALVKDFLQEEKGDLKGILGKGEEDFSNVDVEIAKDYAAKDAWLTWKLFQLLKPQLEKNKALRWLYENIEIPLVRVLAEMEESGVGMNKKRLKELSNEFHNQSASLLKEIYRIAKCEFNVASSKQLQKVLFEDCGLTPTKKTKTGYSTDESVLLDLALEHELPKLILEQRKLAKLTSTYVDKFPELVSEKDDRLHTSYHQTGTATGRLSSSEPNLQNIPIRSPEGLKIREAFIPKPGFCFVSADYSQVELRLMAHLSADKKMIEAFQKNRDIHAETAKFIFGAEDKEYRSRAKAINFGIIYGISAFGLSRQLGIERGEAKQFIDSYFEQFPKVKAYMDQMIELGREKAYTESLFGRRRPLPDIHSKNPTLRQMAERVAINAPIQGTAADIMKWAMVRVAEALKKEAPQSRILLQVHDELIIEAELSETDRVKALLPEMMSDLSKTPVKKLKVPLDVDVSSGDSWAVL